MFLKTVGTVSRWNLTEPPGMVIFSREDDVFEGGGGGGRLKSFIFLEDFILEKEREQGWG